MNLQGPKTSAEDIESSRLRFLLAVGLRPFGDPAYLASKRRGPGQQALQEALSEYNTGSPTRGLHNGYVGKIYGQSQQTPGGVKP